MGGPNKAGKPVAWCDVCEKKSYTSRKTARHIARRHTEHKSCYPCPVNTMLWHVGRLPEAVRLGEITRDEYYSKPVRHRRPPGAGGRDPGEGG